MPLILFLLVFASEQVSSQIIVRVNDARPVKLEGSNLAELPRQTAVLKDHGRQIKYEGVLLQDVLAHNGVDFGKGLRGNQLSSYVVAIGTDGYQVVYSLADFDPTITNSAIILADKRDGRPLGANEGPLRIIVPEDKRPARSVRLLKEIDVVQLKK